MAKRKKSRVEAARHKQDMSRLPDKFDFNGVRIQSGVAVESRSPFRVSKYNKEDNRRLAANNQYQARSSTDWRTIENDREKYAAYLCSREWCEKRERVRERSGGICERCKSLPMDACHHLTYERKYNERLEDLQAICNPCHEFTHGKCDFDPCEFKWWLRYVGDALSCNKKPVPIQLAEIGVDDCDERSSVSNEILGAVFTAKKIVAIRVKLIEDGALGSGGASIRWHEFSSVVSALDGIDEACGFELSTWIIQGHGPIAQRDYERSLTFKYPSD